MRKTTKILLILLSIFVLYFIAAIGLAYLSASSLKSDDAEAIYQQFFRGNPAEVSSLKGQAKNWMEYSVSLQFVSSMEPQLKERSKYEETFCDIGMIDWDSPFAQRVVHLYKKEGDNSAYFDALREQAKKLSCLQLRGDGVNKLSFLVRDETTGESYFYYYAP